MSFRARDLLTPDNVGERLKQLRIEARLSLEVLADELQVAVKHLQAIEESRYQDLPGQVYAQNFVRRYVERMGLNVETAMEQFTQEYAVLTTTQQRHHPILPTRINVGHPWWYRHSRLLLAGAVVAVVAGYFSWQIVRLVTPPNLEVTIPADDMLASVATQIVSGRVDQDAEVQINGEAVEVSEAGEFFVSVDLQTGLNTLKITAKKKRSGERVIVRQVLYEEPK